MNSRTRPSVGARNDGATYLNAAFRAGRQIFKAESYSPDISKRGARIFEGKTFLSVLNGYEEKKDGQFKKVTMKTPEGIFVQKCLGFLDHVLSYSSRKNDRFWNRGALIRQAIECKDAAKVLFPRSTSTDRDLAIKTTYLKLIDLYSEELRLGVVIDERRSEKKEETLSILALIGVLERRSTSSEVSPEVDIMLEPYYRCSQTIEKAHAIDVAGYARFLGMEQRGWRATYKRTRDEFLAQLPPEDRNAVKGAFC